MEAQNQFFVVPGNNSSDFNRKWWKEAVVYQIYPRSFMDSNNDGIGDIKGITSKLDYLKTLGVDVVWLSPVYESPNDDNGYDISDYCAIMKEFGTMDDWQEMVDEMHKRGIKLVMDLVLNHTSDEHEWFVKSRQSKDKEANPYRDYYIWRPPKENGSAPSNWISFFSGSAWQYDDLTGEYYLHLFSKKQPDLNWENPRVREEIHNMIKFWLSRGVDGFRMDVINVISKVPDFPDAQVVNPEEEYHWAGEHFFNGPKFEHYLRDLKEQVLDHHDVFTVGETPDVTPEHGQRFTCEHNGVLNMLFQFELMVVDSQPGKTKWYHQPWELSRIKDVMTRWQVGLHSGWNSLYLENHDQPRSLSRFGNDSPAFRVLSGKMLATWLHMMRGTPYIYQGQEIGMTNVPFKCIDEYRDLESLNYYNAEKQRGVLTEAEILRRMAPMSRDNARTPMQWNDHTNAGFSHAQPWIKVNPNYQEINTEKALSNPNSLFYHYQKLIKMRKEQLVMVYGDYQLIADDHPQAYSFLRTLGNEQLLVIANFTDENATFSLSQKDQEKLLPFTNCEVLISVHDEATASKDSVTEPMELPPYEARVYKLTKLESQSF